MDPETQQSLEAAFGRLTLDIERELPASAPAVLPWLRHLSRGSDPIDRFLEPLMFPLFAPPHWVAECSGLEKDQTFHNDLAFSTLNGYYFLRLVDEVMDDHSSREKSFLSTSAFFHTHFQTVYQNYFPPSHHFWHRFSEIWFRTNDVTVAEKLTPTIDRDNFFSISANKLGALKIPVIAACHHYGQEKQMFSWLCFCDTLGKFFQMLDDACDWRTDLIDGQPSYLLAQANRLRSHDESAEAWILRVGLSWARQQLDRWMVDLEKSARTLGSRDASNYLDQLQIALENQWNRWTPGLEELSKLARALQSGNPEK